MPAKDIYHDAVKQALNKDGWAVTHDPLHLKYGGFDFFIDLGAEVLKPISSGCLFLMKSRR